MGGSGDLGLKLGARGMGGGYGVTSGSGAKGIK